MKNNKNNFRKKIKRFINLALVVVIVFQSLTFIRPLGAGASEVPTGPLRRYIVKYNGVAVVPQSGLEIETNTAFLAQRVDWLKQQFQEASGYKKIIATPSQLPFVIIEADEAGIDSVKSNPNVVSVIEEKFITPTAADYLSVPTDINGSSTTGFSDGSTSFTGSGQAVAIIDSGIALTHPAFASGAIISQACYSQAGEYINATITSLCPGAANSSTADGSAGSNCGAIPVSGDFPGDTPGHVAALNQFSFCSHGTTVGGLIAMDTKTININSANDTVSGVARESKLIPIKAIMRVVEHTAQPDICGNPSAQTETCDKLSTSGILLALNRVLELSNSGSFTTPIASVNMSLGSQVFYSDENACNSSTTSNGFQDAIHALRLKGISVVVASGNSGNIAGNANKIAIPSCVTGSVAVGAVNRSHNMTAYSNSGPLIDLVAQGGELDGSLNGGILTAVGGSNYWALGQGTSFAAPLVSGAVAILRESNPNLSEYSILKILQDSGTNVVENRAGYTALTHKELNIPAALSLVDDIPEITSFNASPSGTSFSVGTPLTLNVVATPGSSCDVYTNDSTTGADVALNAQGQGSLPVVTPQTGNSVTYTLQCVDANNTQYYSQIMQTFSLTGSVTSVDPPVQTPQIPSPGTSGGTAVVPVSTAWVPGTPNAGKQYVTKISSIIGSGMMLLVINRRTKTVRSKKRA